MILYQPRIGPICGSLYHFFCGERWISLGSFFYSLLLLRSYLACMYTYSSLSNNRPIRFSSLGIVDVSQVYMSIVIGSWTETVARSPPPVFLAHDTDRHMWEWYHSYVRFLLLLLPVRLRTKRKKNVSLLCYLLLVLRMTSVRGNWSLYRSQDEWGEPKQNQFRWGLRNKVSRSGNISSIDYCFLRRGMIYLGHRCIMDIYTGHNQEVYGSHIYPKKKRSCYTPPQDRR